MPRISKKSGAYHHGDLRRVLLETAVRVVEKEGIAALSLHALTKRAGVSSGAPYHHFESREQLLAAIAEQGFELLALEMRRAADEVNDEARVRLEALGRGYMRFALAHRGHFRVMFRPELQAQVSDEQKLTHNDAFKMLAQAIERCQREGLAPEGDPMRLVLIAWSTVHGASSLWIDGSLSSVNLIPTGEVLTSVVTSTIAGLLTTRPRAAGV
jgi:AcrR family transcriptional regulator